MDPMCHSCAMPLTGDGKGVSTEYCKYCSDERGTLKSKEIVKQGIAHWFTGWQRVDMKTALDRAEQYMKAMPAWAAR